MLNFKKFYEKFQRERIKSNFSQFFRITLTSLIAALACTGIIYAATTVGTNISTTGTLTATGLTTFSNASTTLFSVSENSWLATTTLSGILDMGNYIIQNIGAAGTDFTATGGLTLADILTISSGGMDVTGLAAFSNNLTLNSQTAPTLISNITIPADANDIILNGNIAYITSSVISIVDITQKDAPAILGTFSHESMSMPHSVIYHNGFLYIANMYIAAEKTLSKIITVDVRIPAKPKFAGYVTHDNLLGAKNIHASGNILGIAKNNPSGGVAFVDISDPYHMKYLSAISDPTYLSDVQSIFCDNQFCYAEHSDDNDFVSIDISDPLSPKIADVLPSGDFERNNGDYMSCNESYCFFGALGGTSVVKITDPYNLSVTDSIAPAGVDSGYNNSVYLSGNTLYIGDEANYLYAIDVSNPASMSVLWTISGAEPFHKVVASGKYLYSATTAGSLYIYELNNFTAPAADIGELQVGNLNVLNNSIIQGDLSIRKSLDIANGLSIGGDLAIGGFKVGHGYNFTGVPSMVYDNIADTNTLGNSLIFDDLLYYTGSGWDIGLGNANLYLYGGTTDGKVVEEVDFDNGGGVLEAALALCEFNGDIYVGTGRGSTGSDAKIFRSDTKTGGGNSSYFDNFADFADTNFASGSTQNQVQSCISYKRYAYFGTSGQANEGDIYYCNPDSASGNDADCDQAGEFVFSKDNTTTTSVYSFAKHDGYLYACTQGSGVSGPLAQICDPAGGSNANLCESNDWSVALDITGSFAGYENCVSLKSIDGCLYMGLGVDAGDNDIARCCATDGKCNSSGEWSIFYDGSTDTQISDIMGWNGKVLFESAGDLYLLDGNGATGAGTATKVWDSSYTRLGTFNIYQGDLFFQTVSNPATTYSDIYRLPLNSGKITDYRGDTTVGNGMSSIVGLVEQTGKTSSIAETNIVIPPTDGLYRVSITQQIISAGSVGSSTATVHYTDATAIARTVAADALDCDSAGTNTTTQIIQAQAIDPISYDATEVSSCDGTWSVYITVERLK